MMVLVLVLVALLLGGKPDQPAYASCNVIPERPLMFYSLLERGSIDRAFVSPDPDQEVTLRFKRPEGRDLAVSDFVISITFKPPLEIAKTFYVAGNDNCEPLEERQPISYLKRLFCGPPKTCFTGSAVGLRTKGGAGGMQLLRFHFPETDAAGPVQIAVLRSGRGGLKTLNDLSGKETCAQIAKRFAPAAVPVCVDQLRPVPDEKHPQAADPQLIALPYSNDYQALCTTSDGISSPPECTGAATEISFTFDSNGDVLLPMIWDNILRRKSSGSLDQRGVLGSTAIEAALQIGAQINIPGKAFLETKAPTGADFSQAPVFEPWDDPKGPNEQTFRGTADQPESVLIFSRRKEWNYTCGNTATACDPESVATGCPTGVDCVQSTPGYFLCDGGAKAGMPCTRSAHCHTPSTSSSSPASAAGAPLCRRISAIAGGVQCYGPDDKPTGTTCKQDSDCGKNAECGRGLFEFRNRGSNGIVKIKRIAKNTRGVCDGGSNLAQPCTNASACPSATCVAFRAAASPYPLPSPTP
jgi:hypothetical protein